MSETTPVEVSEWTRKTSETGSISRELARRSSGLGVSPQAYLSSSTSQPNVRAIVAQRSPNEPAETANTRSPGEQRLTIADSNAPVPEQVKRSTSACVRWTSCSRPSTRA